MGTLYHATLVLLQTVHTGIAADRAYRYCCRPHMQILLQSMTPGIAASHARLIFSSMHS